MMKRGTLFITVIGICLVLVATALMSIARDKNAKPARADFVPSLVFSPPYPPLRGLIENLKLAEIPFRHSEGHPDLRKFPGFLPQPVIPSRAEFQAK
jgi:hypothetical protein